MMTLPPRLQPSASRIRRVHHPSLGPYNTYGDCLRWEYGFACAFCLTHETDLIENGVARTGLMGVEHHVRREENPDRIDDYTNCFRACRFCNQARGTRDTVDAEGRTLLDPTTAPWGNHFKLSDDRLTRRHSTDANATYTAECYDLEDPRKTWLRQQRRERIQDAVYMIREGMPVLKELRYRISRALSDIEILRREEELITRYLQTALAVFQRYRAIPIDAPPSCRCKDPGVLKPARFLSSQSWDAPETIADIENR